MNGRCRYDPEAKRELVEACLQPGISVARMALEHGINANLLRDHLLEADLILGDETVIQVLKESGRAAPSKSYLWAQMTGSGRRSACSATRRGAAARMRNHSMKPLNPVRR
jgi:transposase-like protein